MMKMVARLNIEHFRDMLETETDETKRRMLLRLIDEEVAKLKLTKSEDETARLGSRSRQSCH